MLGQGASAHFEVAEIRHVVLRPPEQAECTCPGRERERGNEQRRCAERAVQQRGIPFVVFRPNVLAP